MNARMDVTRSRTVISSLDSARKRARPGAPASGPHHGGRCAAMAGPGLGRPRRTAAVRGRSSTGRERTTPAPWRSTVPAND